MKRVIKFRAWDKNDNRMITHEQDFMPLKVTSIGVLKLNPETEYESFYMVYPLDRFEIMQFTGLHDKNGKEIYEGDWCSAMFRDRNGIQVIQGKIIIDDFMWCIDCTGSVGNDIFSINRPHDFEVIGNIYEHPNLIK